MVPKYQMKDLMWAWRPRCLQQGLAWLFHEWVILCSCHLFRQIYCYFNQQVLLKSSAKFSFIRDMDILDKLGCHKACKVPPLGYLFPETFIRCQGTGKKDMKTLNHGRIREWLKKSWQNKIRALCSRWWITWAEAIFRSFSIRNEMEAQCCICGVNMLC